MRLALSQHIATVVSAILWSCSCTPSVDAFAPISSGKTAGINAAVRTLGVGKSVGGPPPLTVLSAKQKKRRRKRKVVDPGAGASAPSAGPAAPAAPAAQPEAAETTTAASSETKTADLKVAEMAAAASQFDLGADGFVEDDVDEAEALPLPDIREARARRQERQEMEEEAEIQKEFKPRIDRTDLEAMKKVCRISMSM